MQEEVAKFDPEEVELGEIYQLIERFFTEGLRESLEDGLNEPGESGSINREEWRITQADGGGDADVDGELSIADQWAGEELEIDLERRPNPTIAQLEVERERAALAMLGSSNLDEKHSVTSMCLSTPRTQPCW